MIKTLEKSARTKDEAIAAALEELGMDRDDVSVEIVERAKAIGTFDTSILPYEDCCTVFVPQHPVTKPKVEKLRASEALVDFTEMIETAIKNAEIVKIHPHEN